MGVLNINRLHFEVVRKVTGSTKQLTFRDIGFNHNKVLNDDGYRTRKSEEPDGSVVVKYWFDMSAYRYVDNEMNRLIKLVKKHEGQPTFTVDVTD